MDERNYRRKSSFERLAADMTALIEYLGRMTRECLTPAG